MSKRSSSAGLVILLLVLGMIVAGRAALEAAGMYLGPRDPLIPADAVIAISGNNPERVRTAARLAQHGYARWLVLSGGPPQIFEMRRAALQLGVPASQILLDETGLSTTRNARGSAHVMMDARLRTAILVTSPYHMRRAIIVFRREFRPYDIEVRAYPAEPSIFRPKGWWRRPRDREFVVREYAKLAALLIGIR